MRAPTDLHPQRSPILALFLALLFLAGSFTIGAADPGQDGVPSDVFVPTAQDMGPTPEEPGHEVPGQPEPLSEPTGQQLYGTFWEENLGQWAQPALWVVRGGPTVALAPDGLLVPDRGGIVRMDFVDGHGTAVQVVEGLPSTTSVFGPESITGARHAERIRMEQVWPGIDFDLYFTDAGLLEFDFRIHPGADPAMARMQVSGATPAIQDGRLALGSVSFQPPHSFQGDQVVPSSFRLDGDVVSFELGAYDPQRLLVIDPIMEYGTLVAPATASTVHRVYASKETPMGIYFAGSLHEPYTDTWHPRLTQAFEATGYGEYVGFFVHLHPDSKELLSFVQLRIEYQQSCSPSTWCWSGVFAYDIDVDAAGRVYLVGQTGQSGDWGLNLEGIPVVGGEVKQGYGYFDGFLARFEPQGDAYELGYSTHVGGKYPYSYYDSVNQVIVNPDGTFWIAGAVHDRTIYPVATDRVIHSTSSMYYVNIFAMLFKDAPVPEPQLTTMFGGHSYYYNVLSGAATDEDANLYFVGSVATRATWLPAFPTTPDALMPTNPGSDDHFYGKFATNGSLEHLSFWGTGASDEPARDYAGLGGPGIDVIGPDEIVIAGTAGTCCVPLSGLRLTPDGYGSRDGYISHIHFDEGLIFSTHVGSPGTDYVNTVRYDETLAMYFVGGSSSQPVEPDIPFGEQMPRATHNGAYDAFVTAIQPARIDASSPLDQQESMVAYTMYVGNEVGSSSDATNRVHDLEITATRNLLVGGNQGGSWDVADAAPTAGDPLENGPGAGLYYTAFFQQYLLLNGLDIRISDWNSTAQTPEHKRFNTRTLTDVSLKAVINTTILQDVDLDDLRWDLDADGVFDDADGEGLHLVRRDHEETTDLCVQAPPAFPTAPPITTCIEAFFKNRPPVIQLELLSEPAGFLDPLAFFHTGEDVWYDAALTVDPEGRLDYESIQWIPEVRDPTTGTWVPDPSAVVGGEASLGLVARYSEPGQKRMTLVVKDVLGAASQGSLAVAIVADPPVLECALGGPVRVDRWIDLDVRVTETGAPIKNWTLEPGMDLATMEGEGAPPIRIRTPGTLPALGEGTAELVVRDEVGTHASCEIPYVIGPRKVTADFAWSEPLAGERVHFTDRSFPDVPQRPIVSWEWHVDGIAMSTAPNTTHVFAHPGLYLVSLRVGDGYHADTYRVPIKVLPAPPGPVARIGIQPPPYVAGESLQFTDESLAAGAPLVRWAWEIGGRDDARTDPVVALPPGDHVVRLTVHDLDGRVGRDEVTIHVVDSAGVVPEFTASTIEPVVGEAVRFIDVSRIGGAFVEAREWSFADGSRAGQGTAVEHTYWHPGTYDVTLTLFDSEGVRYTVTHAITVVVPGSDVDGAPGVRDALLPVADAGVDRRVQAGSVVRVDASESLMPQSSGVVASWRQKAGPEVELVADGLAASLRVPYAPGEVIALEVVLEDAAGASLPDVVRLHIVSEHADDLGAVPPPDVRFQVERTGTLVRLAAPQHGVGAKYVWDLGDGATATGREVVHEYASHKTYSVQLTVRDVHGQESTAIEDVEVRSAGDARGQELASSRATLYGHDVWTVVLAGLAVATAASVCAFIVRRR